MCVYIYIYIYKYIYIYMYISIYYILYIYIYNSFRNKCLIFDIYVDFFVDVQMTHKVQWGNLRL